MLRGQVSKSGQPVRWTCATPGGWESAPYSCRYPAEKKQYGRKRRSGLVGAELGRDCDGQTEPDVEGNKAQLKKGRGRGEKKKKKRIHCAPHLRPVVPHLPLPWRPSGLLDTPAGHIFCSRHETWMMVSKKRKKNES